MHPAYAAKREASNAIKAWLTELGMTPAARARIVGSVQGLPDAERAGRGEADAEVVHTFADVPAEDRESLGRSSGAGWRETRPWRRPSMADPVAPRRGPPLRPAPRPVADLAGHVERLAEALGASPPVPVLVPGGLGSPRRPLAPESLPTQAPEVGE